MSLSDAMMPNGKKFVDCTFAEVKAFGEPMSQIAEKIGWANRWRSSSWNAYP
jgi:hypothetical protein